MGLDVCSLIDDINISKERLSQQKVDGQHGNRENWELEKQDLEVIFGTVQRRWYTAQRFKCLNYPSKRLVIIWLSIYRFLTGREGAD